MTTEDPQAPPTTGPDAAAVYTSEWPMRPIRGINGTRLPQYQAIVRRVALDEIRGHGKSITSAEVCGVLVGNVFRDEHGPYLYVAGAIRGDRASGLSTQVTFTAETWSEIQSVMDRDHSDERIVGWYHTHPGFGIFLSGMDLFIQDHFFNLPWQVALVYDPIGGDEGMFFWKEGKADRQAFLIEEEDTRAHAPTLAETEAAQLLSSSEPDAFRHAPQQDERPNAAAENRWSPAQARREPTIPGWLIGVVAFTISFGFTIWAMFSHNNEVVTVPHHVDHSDTQQQGQSPSSETPGGR
jgi:proteasome lid subunit RPN8/RPN11